MHMLIAMIVALFILAAILGLMSKDKEGEINTIIEEKNECHDCSGERDSCIHDSMLRAAVKDVVYYDDEELDVFKGKDADSYTDEEVKLFTEILYTMREGEVEGWIQSLMLRGIQVPNQIKDEVILLLS